MIHQFKKDGYNIVIDNNSGSIHSVDELAYDIIHSYSSLFVLKNNKNKEESIFDEKNKEVLNNIISEIVSKHSADQSDILETIEDIETLISEGKLFSEDDFSSIAQTLKQKMGTLKAICLHVAHDCNMDCQYCFAGKGHYSGDKGLMKLDIAKKAIDFLIANSGNRRNLEVDFFGGEPLLNWELCKETVKYARKIEKEHNKNFRFTLTTNGLLVNDEVIDFSNENMCNVVLSLDGRKETNDRMRKTKSGGGTYDLVLEKFKKFAEKRGHKDYYVRGTFTKNNLDFAKDLIHMADLGFKELSIEPVVTSDDVNYAIDEADVDKIMENYDILTKEMNERAGKENSFNFYHYDIDFMKGTCVAKRVAGCGVGTEYLAITPEGDIYPCHQFVGDEEYLLGNLETGIVNFEKKREFEEVSVYSREDCIDCFAKLYCSGGCCANSYHTHGTILKTHSLSCTLQKKRVENSIAMEIKKLDEEDRI